MKEKWQMNNKLFWEVFDKELVDKVDVIYINNNICCYIKIILKKNVIFRNNYIMECLKNLIELILKNETQLNVYFILITDEEMQINDNKQFFHWVVTDKINTNISITIFSLKYLKLNLIDYYKKK